MPIDPSIALQTGQGVAPINPLGMATQAQGLLNAQVQNRLTSSLADRSQQAYGNDAQNAVGAVAMSVLPLPDAQIGHALMDRIEAGVHAGLFPRDQAQQWLNNIGDTQNPAHLRQMVASFGIRTLDPAGRYAQIYGTPGTMTNGQAVQPGAIQSGYMQSQGAPGFVPSGQPIQQYPSRSELASRVEGPVGPNGESTQVPLGSITPASLGGAAAAGLGDGSLPPALRNPNAAPAAASGGAAAPASPGAVSTGLGPAQVAAQSKTGDTGAIAFNDISALGGRAQAQNATLSNMLNDANQFVTGPGQDKIKQFQSVMQKYAPGVAASLGIKSEAVAANVSFDKLAAQIADAQGAGSDARLAVNQAANPSSHLDANGVQLVIRQLQGNNDYLMARRQLAAQYPNKADVQGFEANIGSKLDPRAFQYNRLTPEQKATYYKNLPANEKPGFQKSYLAAQQAGLLNVGQ